MNNNILFIKRANDLAWRGFGNVSPNPLVGAVIVYNDRVIGEGWHQKFGEAHAEVNAFNSIRKCDMEYLKESSLYVSLEPCNYYGKTPACTDLIILKGLKNIFINSIDITDEVNGKGVDQLKINGINVTVIREYTDELDPFNFRRKSLLNNKPYIICKFAESIDGFIGTNSGQVKLTSELTDRFTHRIRSKVDAIMIGTNTAMIDDPQLSTRFFPSDRKTLRIVIDNELKLPKTLKIFNDGSPTWIINTIKRETYGLLKWVCFDKGYNIETLLAYLYQHGIGIVLLEGGSQLIQSFHDRNLIDEYYKITSPKSLEKGIKSPMISGKFEEILRLRGDSIKHQYS